MSRGNIVRSLVIGLLVIVLLGAVGAAAYQFGITQGAELQLGEGALAPGGLMYRGYGYSPFFWGFGLFRGLFIFFGIFLLLRLIFRPWGMRRHRGWGMSHAGPWGDRMKEVHDQWHAEHPESGGEADRMDTPAA